MSDEETTQDTPLEGLDLGELKPAVFERLLRDSLRYAIVADNLMELPEVPPAGMSNGEREAYYAAWHRDVYAFLKHSVIAHFLIRLHENVPRIAEAIAAEVSEFLEAGDAYPEWVWQWATDRGMDPEAIIAEARAKREEWLARPPHGEQKGNMDEH